ncbi:MAG: hypothetical protein MUC85_03985 [Anaerolineales bacterium]|jgi:hypothetical protein|nr:hypothetical protein [Anaerolineales bacterium]
MAKQKIDGVIEAVRYAPDGSLAWVRAYERRGPTYSDVVILPREELIGRLKAGKRFVIGQRREFLSSEFILQKPVSLQTQGDRCWVVTSDGSANQDHLEGAPLV